MLFGLLLEMDGVPRKSGLELAKPWALEERESSLVALDEVALPAGVASANTLTSGVAGVGSVLLSTADGARAEFKGNVARISGRNS